MSKKTFFLEYKRACSANSKCFGMSGLVSVLHPRAGGADDPAQNIGDSSRLPRLLALHSLSDPGKTRAPGAGYALDWERAECSTLGEKCGVWEGAGQTGVPGGWLRLCHRLAVNEAGAL